VGVSNDATNFLNSSIGSRVAPRWMIMIIASLGMLAGVTFSSGMMEVARKGIFHPDLFLMPELITIFLAVMLTDIILLDLFWDYFMLDEQESKKNQAQVDKQTNEIKEV
jgi:phosphate/sulfate permease